jgi:tRNA-Thr(GGU) m(6)t(6)A37 methyltransferase TsaA
MTTNDKFDFRPIGIIRSPHKELSKIPIQPVFCEDIEGTVILDTQYIDGLQGLQEFSHIYLFYYFNQSDKTCLRVKPYLSDEEYGIFATRAPDRPNKLGMSLVRLVKVENNILHVRDIDILDSTPLLDIKPYIQRFDSIESAKSGWQDAVSDDVASVRGLRDFNK